MPRGESSIAKIKKLLEYFQLPVVALYDADVKEAHAKEKGVFFTQGICFEQDLAQTMLLKGKRQALDRDHRQCLAAPPDGPAPT